MTMTRGTSSSCPASATACAWLPDEKATTPRRRSSGEPRQRVVGAAELEGARALEVLALEEHVAPVRSSAEREVTTGVVAPPRRSAGQRLDVGERRKGSDATDHTADTDG